MHSVKESSSTNYFIGDAAKRVAKYLHRTPILKSSLLNERLGHEFYFKAEPLQKIGAFKARGALNVLLTLQEQNQLPKKVVAFSSGNHAQGVASAAKTLGLEATILMPEYTSSLKKQATLSYGANLIITKDRVEAESRAQEFIDRGDYFIHPYANLDLIRGQGTACYEALIDTDSNFDAVFAPCGGGGLLSGTYMAVQELSPSTKVIGSEPSQANDASRSLKEGKIYRFDHSPNTICDGVMTLSIADITFEYLKKLDDFIEVEEEKILYWTQWLIHLLKLNIEPSSALAMAAAHQYIQKNSFSKPQKILIILSGGNIGADKQKEIWEKDFLSIPINP